MGWNKWLWGGLMLAAACSDLRKDIPADAGMEKAGSHADASRDENPGDDNGGGSGGDAAAESGGSHSAAAGSGGKSGNSAGKSGAAGNAAGGGGSMSSGGAGAAKLAFTPANVPASAAMSADGDLVFNTAGCSNNPTFDTSSGKLSGCDDKKVDLNFSYQEITQPDTSLGDLPAALLVTHRFVIEQGMRVSVVGNRPLIIVALDEALITGQLEAAAKDATANGGGFGPTTDGQPGLGPGGGGKPNGRSGGGGGGFCGKGGQGGEAMGLSAQGGKAYGKPENVPLIGGSSGAKVGYYASAGGGAIQISAGNRIEVSALGVITVSGGGASWTSNGGGAGGAILLEAPSVRVLGHLAANGGSGSANNSADTSPGADGSTDDQPALGGRNDSANGGDGSAGSNIDGKPGAAVAMDSTGTGGGGGGGAGRIRINAKGSGADYSMGLISPGTDTACFSVGMLP